jgi:signal transduction histidine kinase
MNRIFKCLHAILPTGFVTNSLVLSATISLSSGLAQAGDNCTATKKRAVCLETTVQERTTWACDLIKKKGKDALAEIKAMRYECCEEPNYVWINDMTPKMVMHPIKKEKDGMDLSNDADPKGKKLFVEFVKSVKEKPDGAWVDYMWPKFGEKEPTTKKSWVMGCKVGSTAETWVAGSGTWM